MEAVVDRIANPEMLVVSTKRNEGELENPE
jgi:hypothetical protein